MVPDISLLPYEAYLENNAAVSFNIPGRIHGWWLYNLPGDQEGNRF